MALIKKACVELPEGRIYTHATRGPGFDEQGKDAESLTGTVYRTTCVFVGCVKHPGKGDVQGKTSCNDELGSQ